MSLSKAYETTTKKKAKAAAAKPTVFESMEQVGEALKAGKLLRRKGWHSRLFLFQPLTLQVNFQMAFKAPDGMAFDLQPFPLQLELIDGVGHLTPWQDTFDGSVPDEWEEVPG